MDIKYIFKDIKQKQFAIFPDKFAENVKTDLQINLDISSEVNADADHSVIRYKILLEIQQKKKTFLLIEIECYFLLTKDSWEKVDDNKYKLPIDFIRHLALLSISTIRGIVYAKTEDSKLKGIILPSIDVSKLVIEDYIVEIN